MGTYADVSIRCACTDADASIRWACGLWVRMQMRALDMHVDYGYGCRCEYKIYMWIMGTDADASIRYACGLWVRMQMRV